MASAFSPKEREYIRRELDMFFSTFPTVAEGFQLKNWRGGPDAGKPKIPGVTQGLIKRGLMRLDVSQRLPRVFFNTEGLAELKTMMADGRVADPVKFAHIRTELGIDPPIAASASYGPSPKHAETVAAQGNENGDFHE